MPLDAADVVERAAALNERYRHHAAHDVLHHALGDAQVGRVALVSSFGAESVVLLHMVALVDRTVPVLFLETGMLFPETLAYQREVSDRLGLTDVRLIRPFPGDEDGTLHLRDTDACCDLRKTQPLQGALRGFDAWITGRKRFQGGRRAEMEFFEVEEETGRLKINPLAHWAPQDLQDYMTNNHLPRHPLVAQGYPSLGCAPCTTPVAPGEDDRAGRWRGEDKDECGIHFVNGRLVRGPAPQQETQMNVIVTDAGFASDDWLGAVAPLAERSSEPGVDVGSDTPWPELAALVPGVPASARDVDSAGGSPGEEAPDQVRGTAEPAMIRIAFPAFSDGRGFTLARRLRQAGYAGRLRAAGHVLADQYAMARRCGFDEVEISADLARRQPEAQWLARAAWGAHDYQSRLGKRGSVAAR